MKKIIYSVLALLMGVSTFTGCTSWIEEDPDSLITPEMIGDSDDAARQWVTGVYSKWLNDMFRYNNLPRVFDMDDDYTTGPDWLFGGFGAGNPQADQYSVVDPLWEGGYNLISRANKAENEIKAMNNISESAKNNYIGEVKFQKAFVYFLLVQAYGPVPVQKEYDSEDKNEPRQSVDSVYNYIIKNLTDASMMMYKNTDANYRTGHVSAGSAAGLLAKVYATMASAAMPVGTPITVRTGPAYDYANDTQSYTPLQTMTFNKTAVSGYENMDSRALYTEAARWAKAVIDGEFGNYELLPYSQLWLKSSANASEFMFSVGTVNGDETYKSGVHLYYAGLYRSGTEFITSGLWIGNTRHWYDLFSHDDYRITQGVQHRWRVYYQESWNGAFYYPYTNEYAIMATGTDLNGTKVGEPTGIYADGLDYVYNMSSECLAFTTKYSDVTNSSVEAADANWPFLRYADVQLIYAEAMNELDNPSEAITYLNNIRRRSNATEASLTGNGALDTKDKIRSAIIEERAKEFACEGQRRWDLLRWGIYLDAMNVIGSNDDAGISKTRQKRNLLFPIPQSEINTNSTIKENNPGWN